MKTDTIAITHPRHVEPIEKLGHAILCSGCGLIDLPKFQLGDIVATDEKTYCALLIVGYFRDSNSNFHYEVRPACAPMEPAGDYGSETVEDIDEIDEYYKKIN